MFNPLNLISKFIKSGNQKELDRIGKIVEKINLHEKDFKNLNDDDFPKKTNEFKNQIKDGKTLDELLPEAFALVKDLRENYKIFCSIVVYPVIPKGLILLRLIPTASHNFKDIEETLEAFSSIRDRLVSGVYKKISEKLT